MTIMTIIPIDFFIYVVCSLYEIYCHILFMLDTSLTMMGVLVSDISVLRTLFRLKNVSDTIVNGLGWIARFLRRLNLMKPPMRLKITTQSGLRIIRLIQHYWKKKAVTNEKCLSTAAGDDELKICTLYLCQGCVEISI